MATENLTAEQARTLYRYDPDTGILYRRHRGGREKVGKAKSRGYLVVGIGGKQYQAHRLAWLIHYGEWPKHEIDHVNGIKTDNRIENLRDVPHTLNVRNRAISKRARVIGPVREGDNWIVILPDHMTTRAIGPFATSSDAHAAFERHAKWALPHEGQPEPEILP